MSETLIITHNGRFHVDEIFAIAILSKFILNKKVDSLKIIRTRNSNDIKSFQENQYVYVIDVGEKFESEMKNFDHHQPDDSLVWKDQLVHKEQKFEKINLSACGLVWHEFLSHDHRHKYSADVIQRITEFVQKVDLCDNGLKPWLLTPIFSGYNTYSESDVKAADIQFRKALREVEKFLENVITNNKTGQATVLVSLVEIFKNYVKVNSISKNVSEKMGNIIFKDSVDMLFEYFGFFDFIDDKKAMQESVMHFFENVEYKAKLMIEGDKAISEAFQRAVEEGHEKVVLFYGKSYHARSALREMSPDVLLFATFHPETGEWDILSVNKEKDNPYQGRILMPSSWAGKRQKELEEVSGFKGMFYCHKLRFLTIFRGNEKDCLKVCHEIIKIAESEK